MIPVVSLICTGFQLDYPIDQLGKHRLAQVHLHGHTHAADNHDRGAPGQRVTQWTKLGDPQMLNHLFVGVGNLFCGRRNYQQRDIAPRHVAEGVLFQTLVRRIGHLLGSRGSRVATVGPEVGGDTLQVTSARRTKDIGANKQHSMTWHPSERAFERGHKMDRNDHKFLD
jgi:hypothetical protein